MLLCKLLRNLMYTQSEPKMLCIHNLNYKPQVLTTTAMISLLKKHFANLSLLTPTVGYLTSIPIIGNLFTSCAVVNNTVWKSWHHSIAITQYVMIMANFIQRESIPVYTSCCIKCQLGQALVTPSLTFVLLAWSTIIDMKCDSL